MLCLELLVLLAPLVIQNLLKVSDRDRECESRANNFIEGFPLVTRCSARVSLMTSDLFR